ncbi:MAG: glycosyltransferase family 4 protein [Bacteroidota bacterium]
MRIVFVLEHYHPYIGGAERLFQLLAEALAAQGHEVTVLTTRYDAQLPAKERHNAVQIIRIQCQNRYLFTFLSLPTVWRYARQADLIHTTTYNAALPAWIAARLRGKKVIVTFHEVWDQLWFRLPFASALQKRAYYLFEQLLLRLPFDHYIAVSEFTRQALIQKGISPSKISRIYNGLHYETFAHYHHQAPQQFTYTYFGRLGISKGLDLLLPAAHHFCKEHPDSRLVLILPKRPQAIFAQVMQLIQQLNLQKHVLIRHELSREELYRQVCQSSCVVIPSYSEGFCFVAAEAVALEVPIVSSGQGALAEVVSGRMIQMERMDVESLRRALERAYEGAFEEVDVRKFRMVDAVQEYLRLYEGLRGDVIASEG